MFHLRKTAIVTVFCGSISAFSIPASAACAAMETASAFFLAQAAYNEYRPQIREAMSSMFRKMVGNPNASIEPSEEHQYEELPAPSIEQIDMFLSQAIAAEPNPRISNVLTRFRELSARSASYTGSRVTPQTGRSNDAHGQVADTSEIENQLTQFDTFVGRESELTDLESELRDILEEMDSAVAESGGSESHDEEKPHSHDPEPLNSEEPNRLFDPI